MQAKELTLLEIWSLIWTKRKMIAKIVIPVTIAAVIISLLLPKWYKATAVILPPSSEASSLGAAGLLGQFGFGNLLGGGQDVSRFIAVLKSQSLLRAVAKKYNFQKRYDADNMEDTLEELGDNLRVDVGEENQIEISFLDRDQEMVAEMTNYIVKCLDSLNIVLHTSQAKNSRQFIYSQVEIALDSLKYLEIQITDFMKKEGVLSLTDQISVGIEKAAELKAEIMAKEIKLTVALKTLESNNSQIKKLRLEIASLKNKYSEFFAEKSGDRLLPNLKDVPDLEMKFLRMKRKAEYYTKVMEFLGLQYEQAKIEEAKEIPTVQVLDEAVRPERKNQPKRAKTVLIAMIISLGICSLYAYFRGRKELLLKQ